MPQGTLRLDMDSMDLYYFTTFKPVAPLVGALCSILFAAGTVQLASWICRWLGWREHLLRLSALFFCVLAVEAVAVQILVMTSCACASTLRVLFYGVCAAGVVWFWHAASQAVGWSQRLARWVRWDQSGLAERTGWCLLGMLVLLGGILSLTPPTDADSISYHLGAPLEILRQHGLVPREDWPVMRLVGAGENLNLLGLGAGVETMGAVLQWAGLAIVVANILSLPVARGKRLGVALAFASMPVFLWLVATQKHQLLPVAAVGVAAILLAHHWRRPMGRLEGAVCACLCFAIACKHSFVLTAGTVALFWVYVSWRRGEAMQSLLKMAVAYGVVALPFHAWNVVLYGDPLPPLLEAFKATPDMLVVNLARMLHVYRDTQLLFPLGLVVPASAGTISTVLGLSVVLAVFNPLRLSRVGRCLVLLGAVQIVLMVVLGQRSSRFFAEAFMAVFIGMLLSPQIKIRSWQMGCVWAQAGATLLMGIVSLWLMMPGLFSREAREHVMSRCSNGYAVCRWLNQVLPADAVVISSSNDQYFMPRRSVSYQIYMFSDRNDPEQVKRIQAIARKAGVNTLVGPPAITNKFQPLGFEVVGEWAPPAPFSRATRNPFNWGPTEKIGVYRVSIRP